MLNHVSDPANRSPVRKESPPTTSSEAAQRRQQQAKENPRFRRALDREKQKESFDIEEKEPHSIFDLSKDQSQDSAKKAARKKATSSSTDTSRDPSKIKKAQADASSKGQQTAEELQSSIETPSEEQLTDETHHKKGPELPPAKSPFLETPPYSSEKPSKEIKTPLENPFQPEKKSPLSEEGMPTTLQSEQKGDSPSALSPKPVIKDIEKFKSKSMDSVLKLNEQQEGQIETEETSVRLMGKKEKPSSSSSRESGKTSSSPQEPSSPFVLPSVQLNTSSSSLQNAPEVSRPSPIQELAAQMIKEIQVLKQGDMTSTRVTLRSPPILEGATLTLETSAHAEKEFNVSFGNLSNEGQLFLDRKLKENSLNEAMKEEGYVVHIIKTTTEDVPLFQEQNQQNPQDRDQQQPRDQKKRPFQEWEEEK